MISKRFFVAVVFLLVLPCTQGAASDGRDDACRTELLKKAGSSASSYRRRPGGYCDGLVRQDHFGQIELVSATLGRACRTSADGEFEISVVERLPIPTGLDVEISGRLLRRDATYRLDANISAQSILRVDARPALLSVNATMDSIGIKALANANFGSIVLPVQIGADSCTSKSQVVLTMVTPFPTIGLCDTLRPEPPGEVLWDEKRLPGSTKAGEFVTVELPADASGVFLFEVTAVGPGEDTYSLTARVAIPSK